MRRISFPTNCGLPIPIVTLTNALLLLLLATACSGSATSVIFVSDRDGDEELYSVGPGGGGETNLTNTPLDEFGPVVSPYRKSVAFLTDTGESIVLEVICLL